MTEFFFSAGWVSSGFSNDEFHFPCKQTFEGVGGKRLIRDYIREYTARVNAPLMRRGPPSRLDSAPVNRLIQTDLETSARCK